MQSPARRPALLVADLDQARRFYVHALGCRVLAASSDRLELELAAQPVTLRTTADAALCGGDAANDDAANDEEACSEISFLLGVDDWCRLSERLREHEVETVVEPTGRFSAVPGEQCVIRLSDPAGHTIELRGFAREEDILAA